MSPWPDAGRSELAAVLAAAIRQIGGVDLVITGDSSVDVAAKMVPTVLAGLLGWPAVAEVTAVTGQAGALRVERAIPGGVQVLEVSGPGRARRVRGCGGAPRAGHEGTARGGQEAGRAAGAQRAEGAAQPDAAVTVTGRAVPERRARKGQLIDTADPAAAAAELVTALRAAGAL